ncbi:MAG: DEAD/DEAH box helicase [Microthrixaceae bacterium]|nr:DEAD/DEAH box helicase [Microthrixaceae bacterium]
MNPDLPDDLRRAVDAVTDEVLHRTYSDATIQRGVRYARQDRAMVDMVEDDFGAYLGRVQGSDREPYNTWFSVDDVRGSVRVSDDCDCPLGGRCKHVVALILSARGYGYGSRPSDTAAGATQLALSDDTTLISGSGLAVPAPSVSAAFRRPTWRGALQDFARAASANATPTDLALQFSVEQRTKRFGSEVRASIAVRPVRTGARGTWVKTGASWRDITDMSKPGLAGADHEQRQALAAIVSNLPSNAFAYGSHDAYFDALGHAVWKQLDDAQAAGVAFIRDDTTAPPVRLLERSASVVVDLTLVEQGLLVRPTIDLSDPLVELGWESSSVREWAPIGRSAHGVFLDDGTTLALARIDPVPATAVGALLDVGPFLVPTPEIDDFLDTYVPRIARSCTVASSDSTVDLTPRRLDGFVAVVNRTTLNEASLQWHVVYRRGAVTSRFPLHGALGAPRDRRGELAMAQALDLPTDRFERLADGQGHLQDLTVRGSELVVFMTEVLDALGAAEHITVEVSESVPSLHELSGDALVSLTVSDSRSDAAGSGDSTIISPFNDWFDLSIEVTIDGHEVPFAQLFTALALGEATLILDDGSWVSTDRPEFEQLRALIEEARGLDGLADDASSVRINRFQTDWWDEITRLGVVASQSDRWQRSVAQLGELTAPTPVPTPLSLDAKLRDYQHVGLDWLAFLQRSHLGGVLADDMGLGKTVQVLALFLHLLEEHEFASAEFASGGIEADAGGSPGSKTPERPRFLVVAPTSVVRNWQHEAERFAPDLVVRCVTETEARRLAPLSAVVDGADVVVTSYTLFRLEFDDYAEHRWTTLVLDEAQMVKNHRSKAYLCVRRLEADTKIAITGTPLENSLMDLWSLLSITAPGLYPDPKRFAEVYQRPIERGFAPERLATLRRRIAPLMRRRTKDEVLAELPPKTELEVPVDLSPKHKKLYDTQLQQQRRKVLGLVGDMNKNRFEILKSLTLLRQLSLAPGLIDDEYDYIGSAKIDRLVEDLGQILAEGHRALVFSQFTSFLSRVRDRLDDEGITYAYLDGRTRRRDEAISSFKNGDTPVFLISLKAGGFGLNLTEADYCFVLDPWWNPATEAQAIDRTHRIGQTNPVIVYRYVSVGTIEEKVMELKERKAALFDSVMSDDGLSGALTEADIRNLFSDT